MNVPAVDASDTFLRRVAAFTATHLEAAALAQQLTGINEQKQLQPVCARTARTLAARFGDPLEVSTQHKLAIPDWPRLGSFDLCLTFGARKPVLVELKCGACNDSLGPCVWDAVKCAFALWGGQASSAYLLAGAPTQRWSAPTRGAEFFSNGVWETSDLRNGYRDWWRHWERRGDPQPARLPSSFSSVAAAAVPLTIGGAPWELRLARIGEVSTKLLEWPPLVPSSAPLV